VTVSVTMTVTVTVTADLPMLFGGGGPTSVGSHAPPMTPYTPLAPEQWDLREQALHKFYHPTEVRSRPSLL